MTATIINDKRTYEGAKYLRAHYGIHSISRIGEFNGAAMLPDATVSVLASYVNSTLV